MTLPAYLEKYDNPVLAAALVNVGTTLQQAGNLSIAAYLHAGAPTNGTSGTLAGVAIKGALLLDTTNATVYQNSNTLASPTWTIFTTASGSGAFTGTFDGNVGSATPGTVVATAINGPVGTVTPAAASVTTLAASGASALAAVAATTIAASGLVSESVAATVTAHATGGQGSAFALTKQLNYISVCATTADSVRLPASAAGLRITVINGGVAAAQVFGAGTDTVDSVATATGVPLGIGKRADYFCVAAGNWVSAQLGVAGA
jgi:hypothetical protein